MTADIGKALREILETRLAIDPEIIHPDAMLVDDLGFDSVGFAIGLVAIEEELGLGLSQEGMFGCDTVADLIALAEQARTAASRTEPDSTQR